MWLFRAVLYFRRRMVLPLHTLLKKFTFDFFSEGCHSSPGLEESKGPAAQDTAMTMVSCTK